MTCVRRDMYAVYYTSYMCTHVVHNIHVCTFYRVPVHTVHTHCTHCTHCTTAPLHHCTHCTHIYHKRYTRYTHEIVQRINQRKTKTKMNSAFGLHTCNIFNIHKYIIYYYYIHVPTSYIVMLFYTMYHRTRMGHKSNSTFV